MSTVTGEVITMYVLVGNGDQTEGRGPAVERGLFTTLEDAVAENATGKWGVQGIKNDCDIYVRKMFLDEKGRKWVTKDEKIYGYHNAVDGKWRHGFLDDRDLEIVKDPDFAKYMELKRKFEGAQ